MRLLDYCPLLRPKVALQCKVRLLKENSRGSRQTIKQLLNLKGCEASKNTTRTLLDSNAFSYCFDDLKEHVKKKDLKQVIVTCNGTT